MYVQLMRIIIRLNFYKIKQLTFQIPDEKKFPALSLAIEVAHKGGTLPGVLNAADEEAVESFLRGRISFTQIYSVIQKVVLRHKCCQKPTLEDILAADTWAREEAKAIIQKNKGRGLH